MKYVLVSGGNVARSCKEKHDTDMGAVGVISGIGKGVIGKSNGVESI